MDKMSNAVKATVVVLGVLALVGLGVLLLPILKIIGGALLAIIGVLLVPAIIVGGIYLVYKYLNDRDGYRR